MEGEWRYNGGTMEGPALGDGCASPKADTQWQSSTN
jgi:hypothetical protein